MLSWLNQLLKKLCSVICNPDFNATSEHPFGKYELHGRVSKLDQPMYGQVKTWAHLATGVVADFAYIACLRNQNDLACEWISDGVSNVTGYSLAELNHPDGWFQLVHSEDLPFVQAWFLVQNSDRIDPHDIRIMTKSGEIRWLRHFVLPQWDDAPEKVTRIYGCVRDITELKAQEIAIQEEYNLLRTLMDNLPDYIYIKDVSSRLLLVNEASLRHLGAASVDEVIGKTDFDFSPPELAQQYHADEQALFQLERPLVTPYKPIFDHQTGARKWVSTSKFPFYDADGQIAGLVGMNRDITRLKVAEEALRREKEFADRLIEMAQVIILVLDLTGRIVHFNRYMEGISGYKIKDVRGLDWVDTFVSQDEREQVRTRFFGVVSRDDIRSDTYRVVTKTGDEREIEWHHQTFKGLNGDFIGALAVGQDISERKRAEEERNRLFRAVSDQKEQLRALANQLAVAQEAERKALARELHDQVGQNLTALDLNLNIIQATTSKEWFQTIALVRDLLEDSLSLVAEMGQRIRDVMANLRPPVLDDYGLVAALKWYGSRVASRSNLSIRVQSDRSELRLHAHVEETLFRIAQEALTNVAKHARAEHVAIDVHTGNGIVRMIVSDDGDGFQREEVPTARGGHWGLITMAERAEAIGGGCHIKSQPGQGTRVIVEVPQ